MEDQISTKWNKITLMLSKLISSFTVENKSKTKCNKITNTSWFTFTISKEKLKINIWTKKSCSRKLLKNINNRAGFGDDN